MTLMKITLYLPDSLVPIRDAAERKAKREGKSLSSVIWNLLERWIMSTPGVLLTSVRTFMLLSGRPVATKPTANVTAERRLLAARLIMEECRELLAELGYDVSPHLTANGVTVVSLTRLAKEAADLHYVTTWAMVEYGINEEPCIAAVCRNNLEKFGPGHRFNEFGKLIPPEGFKKVTLDDIIQAQLD